MAEHEEDEISKSITKDFISVERTFANKNPKMAKRIPRFIFSYLKKTIHEDELNRLLYTHRHKRNLDFLRAIVMDEWNIKIKTNNFDSVELDGRYIVSSNHPLGGLDGIALILALSEKRKDIKFPVNDILMNIPTITDLFVPINKHKKKGSRENIDTINKAFESDAMMPYFPAGLVSRRRRFKHIKDLEWKKSFIIGARNYNRKILPVHIEGRNSRRFYNLANFRKFVGMKANIEMLYLVDEMMRQKNETITINFGNPIDPSVFDDRKTDMEWANLMREHCYMLKDNTELDIESMLK
jgi:putative hemolysin